MSLSLFNDSYSVAILCEWIANLQDKGKIYFNWYTELHKKKVLHNGETPFNIAPKS